MITAILNVYRRYHQTFEKQVKALSNQTIPPKHIWTWQNKAPEKANIQRPKKTVLVNSSYNFFYHGRFALALLAQPYTEYVAILDDDIIPGKQWFENCLNCMKEKPGLYVAVGRRLSPGTVEDKKTQWVGWRGPNEEITELDYGGHCWFLKTDWLRYFWMEPQISFENAEDIQLSFALQKNAGIPTYAPPHPKDNQELWSNTIGWFYGRQKVASHKSPPTKLTKKDWFKQRRDIEQECINRGWKPLYMRRGENQD